MFDTNEIIMNGFNYSEDLSLMEVLGIKKSFDMKITSSEIDGYASEIIDELIMEKTKCYR